MKIPNLRRNLFFAAAAISLSIPFFGNKPETKTVATPLEIKVALLTTTTDKWGRSTIFHKQDMKTLDEMSIKVYDLLQDQAKQSGSNNLILHYVSTLTTLGCLLAALLSHETTTHQI